MSRERTGEYLVLKFYIPDYGIQSRPIPISMREIRARGDEGVAWAVRCARNIFLRRLQHKGQGETIHPSHLKLAKDGKITYTAKLRELGANQLAVLGSVAHITSRPVPRKVGWKRRGETAKERRERWFRQIA